MNYFKGTHFEKDIIVVAVTYYLRYNLSYRDISEIFLEKGVSIHHTTIYRWVQKYAKILYTEWKKIFYFRFMENGRNVYQSQRTMEIFIPSDRQEWFCFGHSSEKKARHQICLCLFEKTPYKLWKSKSNYDRSCSSDQMIWIKIYLIMYKMIIEADVKEILGIE